MREQTTQELKTEFQKGITLLKILRDEFRVDLHLAGMEARQRYLKTLGPRIEQVEHRARQATKSARAVFTETIRELKTFQQMLRG